MIKFLKEKYNLYRDIRSLKKFKKENILDFRDYQFDIQKKILKNREYSFSLPRQRGTTSLLLEYALWDAVTNKRFTLMIIYNSNQVRDLTRSISKEYQKYIEIVSFRQFTNRTLRGRKNINIIKDFVSFDNSNIQIYTEVKQFLNFSQKSKFVDAF